MSGEFEDCPECDGLGVVGNPAVYVFPCPKCKGARRILVAPANDAREQEQLRERNSQRHDPEE